MIEKMEWVLEGKLREKNEPLQNKLQGKPSVGESGPRLLSHPWRPCLLGASQFQEHLQTAAEGAGSPLRQALSTSRGPPSSLLLPGSPSEHMEGTQRVSHARKRLRPSGRCSEIRASRDGLPAKRGCLGQQFPTS